ncbi:hypothetical protein C8F04DRAFT_1290561 [Mycena alexandri]|uniref:Uncharacterized protein n=1 Tax=Mycena alexandri TaxID=1745969 RepID=A0AAD6WXR2_9AGAR|nr:hypothetical protein C8F04DRAFT_1290561 [Mycena alexandri]
MEARRMAMNIGVGVGESAISEGDVLAGCLARCLGTRTQRQRTTFNDFGADSKEQRHRARMQIQEKRLGAYSAPSLSSPKVLDRLEPGGESLPKSVRVSGFSGVPQGDTRRIGVNSTRRRFDLNEEDRVPPRSLARMSVARSAARATHPKGREVHRERRWGSARRGLSRVLLRARARVASGCALREYIPVGGRQNEREQTQARAYACASGTPQLKAASPARVIFRDFRGGARRCTMRGTEKRAPMPRDSESAAASCDRKRLCVTMSPWSSNCAQRAQRQAKGVARILGRTRASGCACKGGETGGVSVREAEELMELEPVLASSQRSSVEIRPPRLKAAGTGVERRGDERAGPRKERKRERASSELSLKAEITLERRAASRTLLEIPAPQTRERAVEHCTRNIVEGAEVSYGRRYEAVSTSVATARSRRSFWPQVPAAEIQCARRRFLEVRLIVREWRREARSRGARRRRRTEIQRVVAVVPVNAANVRFRVGALGCRLQSLLRVHSQIQSSNQDWRAHVRREQRAAPTGVRCSAGSLKAEAADGDQALILISTPAPDAFQPRRECAGVPRVEVLRSGERSTNAGLYAGIITAASRNGAGSRRARRAQGEMRGALRRADVAARRSERERDVVAVDVAFKRHVEDGFEDASSQRTSVTKGSKPSPAQLSGARAGLHIRAHADGGAQGQREERPGKPQRNKKDARRGGSRNVGSRSRGVVMERMRTKWRIFVACCEGGDEAPYRTTTEMLGGALDPGELGSGILHRGDDEVEGIFVKGLIEAPAVVTIVKALGLQQALVNASMTRTESHSAGKQLTPLDGAAPQDADLVTRGRTPATWRRELRGAAMLGAVVCRTIHLRRSSSKKTATIGSSYPGRFGKHVPIKKVLMKSRTQQDKYRNARAEVQQARDEEMDRDELQALRDIQDWDGGVDGNEDQEIRLENVLDGSTRVDISHDGGELREAICQEIEEEARRAK